MQAPRFNQINNVLDLIQTASNSLSIMGPSNSAAFWNSLAKLMDKNNPLNSSYEQMGTHINQLFEHTRSTLKTFGPKDLSQTIYSMAKLVVILRKSRSSGCIVSSLSNLLLNDDATTINEDVFLPLANASVRNLSQSDAYGLSNLAYAYALIKYVPKFDDGSDLFDHIAMQSIKMRAEFAPQGISNTVWAFATVAKRHDALFKAVGDQVVARDHLRDFNPQHLSNIVWAYATAQVSHPKLFENVANHIVQLGHLRDFRPQALSNIVWAYATAEVSHPKLFEKVAEVATQQKEELNSQALSNIVWAYATAGVSHPHLFEKMAKHIVRLDHLRDFKPQALSNIVWSYAAAGASHPELFDKVGNHIVRLDHLRDFKPQELSNTVWAYATAGISHPDLLEKIANHIVRPEVYNQFNPQDLSNTVWAYARAEVSHPGLFDKMANHVVKLDHLRDFRPQNLSNTVWAYATAQVFHPALFDKMASHIVQLDHLEEFIPQALSNIVWAYATAQVSHSTLFQKIADYIAGLDHLKDYKRHELYSTLWAYATEEVSHRELFDKIVIHIAGLGHLGLNLELLSDTMFEHVEANVSHPEYLNELDHLREFDTQNLGAAEASLNDDASHECSSSSLDRCTYEDASWQNNEDDFPITSSGTMVCDQSNAGSQRMDSQAYGVVPHAPYETNRILTLHVSDLSGVTEANVYEMFQISFGIDTVLVVSPKTSRHYKFVVILLQDREKALSRDGYEYSSRRLQIRVAENQQNIPSNLLRTCVWADTRLGKMPMNVCGFNLCGACQRDNFRGGYDRCPFGVHIYPGSNILDRTPRDESSGGAASGADVSGSSIMARSSNSKSLDHLSSSFEYLITNNAIISSTVFADRSTSVINPSTSQDRSTFDNPSSSQLVASSSSSELVAQPSTTSNVPPQTTTELSAPVQARRFRVVRPSEAFFKRKPRVLASAIFMLRLYLRGTVEEVNKRVGRDLTLEMIEAQNKIITATINYVTERYDMILTQLDANGCFPLMRYDDIHNKRESKFIYSISNSRHIEKTKSGMSAGKDGADGRPIDQIPEGTNPNDYMAFFGKIDQDSLDLVERNSVLNGCVEQIRSLSPVCKSFVPMSTVAILCQLEEAVFSCIFPGDPGNRLMERLLSMDSVTDMSVPSPQINEAVADELAGTEVFAPLCTWIRQRTSIFDQMSNDKLVSGEEISTGTKSMVNAMVNLNSTFMQESIANRLTEGSLPNIQVNEYSDAVGSTCFDTMMADLAAEVESLLQAQNSSTSKTMRKTLFEKLSQLYTKDQSFYDLEMQLTGDLAKLAAATVIELEDMISEAIQSGKSTAILLEYQHLLSLKTHEHSTFLKYFSDSRRIGIVYSDNERKDEAAHLYRLANGVLGLVMNSFFVMNAPGRSIAVRLNLSQRFLAVKAVLVQANLQDKECLTKEEERMKAFAMVLEGWGKPSEFGTNTGWDWAAIRLNSPPEYNHGNEIRNKGLQALINPLIDFVGVDGVHWEVFVTLAINLGEKNLEKLYALFGEKIDLSDTTQTMLELAKKQGNRNTETEAKKVRDSRNRLYDDLLKQGLIKKEKGVSWKKREASWKLVLPSRFFGIQSYIASFDYLYDANEAMKQLIRDLDRDLDGGARLPDSLHYDIENEKNKKVLKTAIENARRTSKKKNDDRGKRSSDNIIKFMGDT
jgi:hypothetical protein